MTRFEADDQGERLGLVAETIAAHRERGSEGAVFEGAGGRVEYADRVLTLELDGPARERLEDLLGEFPVFKIEQPATRKAPEGVVHVSAIADPKHAADFVEGVFRMVYGADEGYELRVVRI